MTTAAISQHKGSPFYVPITAYYQAPCPVLLNDDICLTPEAVQLAGPTPHLPAPFEYDRQLLTNPPSCTISQAIESPSGFMRGLAKCCTKLYFQGFLHLLDLPD